MKNKTIANWLIGSMVVGVIAVASTTDNEVLTTLAGLGLMVFSIIGALRVKKLDDTLAYMTLGNLGLFWFCYASNLEIGTTGTAILIWVFAVWLSVKLYKLAD